MSDVNTINGFDYVTETFDKRGRTRYYQRNPNNFFETQNTAQGAAEAKQPHFDFLDLSPERIAETIAKRRQEKEEYKEKYLIDLSESEHDALNILLQNTDKPEEKVYEFATAIKYSKEFNLPLDFTLQNLEAINRNWIGTGTAPSKSNFKAVVDSFSIGANVLKMGSLGNALMLAEKSGNKREIDYALRDLQRLEDENLSLHDKMPRSWLVNLFKDGAQALPFQGATFIPSVIASVAGSPLLGSMVSFGISTTVTAGNEYWELRKAGVKKELAENIAITSGAIQGLIETSLGNIAGFTGKGLGADKIASKVLTRLNATGVFGNFAKGLLHYGVDSVSEGVEEALQELVSAGGKALAATLQGEGVETDDSWTIAGNMWESFKGGITASVILGIPGAIKFTKADIQSSNDLKKAALTTPSEEAFINENKNSPALEGLTEEDKKNELHNLYGAKKQEREAFQKLQDKKEYLSDTARIEGEVMRDDEGNIIYETDENGNPIKERDKDGNLKPIPKVYGAPQDIVRLSNDRLYIQKGKTRVRAGGIVEGEYIAGDPTQETAYNDYVHIHYTYNENKKTVRIDEVSVQNPKYVDIVKEFVRDFGEEFKGVKIEWNPKEETLTKIKNELIAENPNGKEAGVQYFVSETDEADRRANIKLYDRLKQTMPHLSETERHTAVSIFNAIASGAGMDTETYLNTYYADEILTNTPPANMEAVAAQEHIDTKTVQGTTEFKEIANDIKALVYVSEKSDFSTFVHEAAHVARKTMKGDLLLKAEAAFNVENGNWTRAKEEQFARGFEQYLKEGIAPTEELKTVFQKCAEFLTRIYKNLKEVLHINDDIRKVYDELLGGEKSVLREAADSVENTAALKNKSIKEFGYNYSQYYHKGIEAIEKVLKEQAGQVVGAFYREDIGDIDVVYGNDKIGLKKIIDKHLSDFEPFGKDEKGVITGINEIVNNGKLTERNGVTTITYEKESRSFRVGLSKGWNGKGENQWIITAYEENVGSGKGKTLSAVADFNSSQTPEETATVTNTIPENAETVNSQKTVKSKIDEAYDKATEAARLANEESIKQSEAYKKDIAENFETYEAETIQQYKKYNPALSDDEIKQQITQDAKKERMHYDEFVAWKAKEQKKLDDIGDMLFQSAPSEEELNEIEVIRKKYEGTEQWLKAPNGNDSNLNEKQWLQVRTDSFKKWFGDWEHDAKNASKVVDENGEPLVVYHGTGYKFDTFSTPLNMERIFLTKNKNFAHKYGNIQMPLFVNAENVLNIDYKGGDAFEEINIQGKNLESIEEAAEYARENGYTALIASNVTDYGTFSSVADVNDEVIVFRPNQIKSAVENKGSFDSSNNNIYFQTAPLTENEELNEIEIVRKKYERTEQWLKAPNGNDSNLNEKQWLQVRTDSFKKWFGDWEHDAKNASKVVDENGEPLVVYHGSRTGGDFEVFNDSTFFSSDFDTADMFKNEADYSIYINDKWFGHISESVARDIAYGMNDGYDLEEQLAKNYDIKYAQNYDRIQEAIEWFTGKSIPKKGLLRIEENAPVFECFLNFRNPKVVDYEGKEWGTGGNTAYVEDDLKNIESDGYDGLIGKNIIEGGGHELRNGEEPPISTDYVSVKPNQIKSAVENKGTFDSENNNIYFQTAPLTEEEKAFKETALQYRKDIDRYFSGGMKGNETVTVCKTTPAILRAVGFDNKPITVSGATLKHITEKHADITQELLNTLPEQMLDPIAVFKSQNKDQPNSRLIFTEHFVNGKPVLAALEMNYEDKHGTINSIRSVYERDVITKSGWNTLQGWIDDGNLLYIDDKRADEWSAITGVSFPLEAFSKLNPSNNIIGENAEKVNTVLTKTAIIGGNAEALYFQVEKEFYDEVTDAETKQEVKENLEKIIIGKDVSEAENLFYSEEEQKKFDLTYNAKQELKQAFNNKLTDIKAKDETFIKMLSSDREAIRSFMKQIVKAADSETHLQEEINRHGTKFLSEAVLITKLGHPLTDKQVALSLDFIKENTEFYRNIFAEINGYEALRSVTKKEAAFINTFADSVFSGKEAKTKSRSEIQDEMFLDEMEDDTKFNEFLNEAARIYFFDFDNFTALDEEDAAYRDEMKRKQDRIYREMRNFSWKGTLAKIKAGEKPTAKSLANIHAQMKNAARSYRALYADIMDRADMQVKDAETTDAIIKTKLKSRPRKSAELDDYKLQHMSNAEKAKFLKALNNEELEERAKLGIITGEDIEKINDIIKEKNANITALKKQIKELKQEDADNTQRIFKLKKQIKDERINRKILADTVKARDVAVKAVMKRISLKSCSAAEAEALAAVQWFLKPQFQKMLNEDFNLVDVRAAEAYRLWKADSEFRKKTYNKQKYNKSWKTIQNILDTKTPETWTNDDIRLLSRLVSKPTVGTTEYNIRESYALWGTSQEFRNTLERLVGHKKDWNTLRNLLENKNIREWTSDDKELARKMLPPRNKFFSLGLYAKTEQNFLDMRTADLTPAQLIEAVSSVLPSEMIAKLKHQPLSQWTVDELLDLAKIITEKHSEGKRKYLAWKETQRQEAAIIRDAGIKSFKSIKDYQEKAASWSSDEKDKKGGLAALRRIAKYGAMRSYAFMEMLDGGKRGTLYALLEYEQRECNDVYKKGLDKRLDKFQTFMKDNNIDIASLDKKHVFENFYIGRDKKDLTLTTQELIGVYMASLDEKSRAAVQYGNLAEQDERDLAKSSNTYEQLDDITEARLSKVLKEADTLINGKPEIKKLVEFLQAEYKAEGLKLYEHNKRVNNTVTEIRENYFPMLRLDVSGEEDVRTTEQKVKGEYATGSQNSIANGQSKARIFIGKANQTAIQLGAVSTYLQSVEANERLYAYDAYAQKLNRVFKGYDSKRLRNTLETAYGHEAVKYLDKQISIIIDPNAGRVFSSTDKLLRTLRGNTAAAYLGWKLSGIIKQGITSPAPFLQYVNPVSYAKAATDLAIHNKEMTEFIYSRSSLMKHRSFDMMQNITEELAKNAKTKGEKLLTSIQQKGMKGLEWIDRACVAPGWLAAFREEEGRLRKINETLEKPLTDLEIDYKASQWADDVLVRTQPSGRAEELAPLFREGGEALRMLLQFQSSLNVIYNNIRHDLPNAIKNKQYARAAGIISGYALAGIAVGAVTQGFGDDDDDSSDKIRKSVYYAFTQYTDSVPIINGIVDSVAEKLITGKTSYKGSSSLYATVEKAAQGTIALSDGDFKKAAGKYAEAAAISLGLPTSGSKEAFYALEQLYNGEFPGALTGRRK